MRVVLDTNVLIDGGSDDFSAAAKIIDAIIDGELTALSTPAIEREYRKKTGQLISDVVYRERLEEFWAIATRVEPAHIDVQIDDVEDRKFLQAAVGGRADLILTSDHHLLQMGEIDQIRIVTPQEGWVIFQEETESSSEWQTWISGMIGR